MDTQLMPDFDKYPDALVPVIVQDVDSNTVLMLGYMNREAWEKTLREKRVCFFSRSKGRLWTKGESSGNFLELVEQRLDCDQDALLMLVKPKGPVCHTGSKSCFRVNDRPFSFLSDLETLIRDRQERATADSYVASLFRKGTNKIAQKVGEEAVELVIEAMDQNDGLFKEEAADLLFHYLILLRSRGVSLVEIEEILKNRHKNS